jgi:flotillin
MDELVKAAGTSQEAVQLIIANKLETLVAEQAKAISNIKIDKVTVWDGGEGKDGKTSTAGFLSGLLKSLPALDDVYQMAGLKLPKAIAPQSVDAEEPKKESKK